MFSQPGFFDFDQLLQKLTKMGDPLERLNRVIPWEAFRADLNPIWENPERKSNAGNKPTDVVLMFKMVILQRLYNISDDQAEYQTLDRASFKRFLKVSHAHVPDAKTLWAFKERMVNKGLERTLFDKFERYLREQGYAAKGGQILDATIVEVPRQRNTVDENKHIKENGSAPTEWKENPHRLCQKDVDARWTQKRNENYYGYKNHVHVDQEHKLIRDYTVTAASVHDSNEFDELVDMSQKDRAIYGDGAYHNQKREALLAEKEMNSKICEKGKRNAPLTSEQRASNRRKSKVRARVEHVFGHMEQAMGGIFMRNIGMTRNKLTIGLMNLVYNFCRYAHLKEPKPQKPRTKSGKGDALSGVNHAKTPFLRQGISVPSNA